MELGKMGGGWAYSPIAHAPLHRPHDTSELLPVDRQAVLAVAQPAVHLGVDR